MNHSANLYKRHRFPAAIIQYAVWLYHRFNLSHRDIEDLLAERGIEVSYESVRLWCTKFGPLYSKRLRRKHPGFGETFFIDEIFVTIAGQRHYLWRAVDPDGGVLQISPGPCVRTLERSRCGVRMANEFASSDAVNVSVPSGDVKQRARIPIRNHQQRAGCTWRGATALLPVLQGAHWDTEECRKARLRQAAFLSNTCNVRSVHDATVLAALEFAQTVENFLSDVSLSPGHLPLPAEFAKNCGLW
jgi:hypothetical protein